MGSSTGTSTGTTASQTNTQPWKPAQPLAKGILGQLEGQLGNTGPNAAESSALDMLRANAGQTPDLAGPTQAVADQFLAGGPDRTGYLTDAYSTLQRQLNPIANAAYDPTNFPGMQDLLSTIRGDVSNSVNSYFAGAGRDLSGQNAGQLARGLSAGLAAPLLAQYNQNIGYGMDAAKSLFGAGGATGTGLSAMDQTILGNKAQGLGLLGQLPFAQDLEAQRRLAIEGQARGIPLQTLGQLTGMAVPLAGLGGTQNTTGQTTQTLSPIQQFYLAAQGAGSLFKGGKPA